MEDVDPDALDCPPHEAVVEGLARSVDRWCIDPSTARLQHVHDAADHPAVINSRLTTRVGWKQRLQPSELNLSEPEIIAIYR